MNKKIVSIALAALLVLSLPLVALADWLYVVTPNGGSVNMRGGPSMDDDLVTSVPYGAAVEVMEYLYGSSWVSVNYDGYYGYIAGRYLADYPAPSPTFVPAPTARPKPTGGGGGGGSSLEKELKAMFGGFATTSYDAIVVPSTPTTYVNLRWAPSKSAPVRAQYWAGSTLHVISENGSWAEVYDVMNGQHGFMVRNFLSVNGVGAGVGGDS